MSSLRISPLLFLFFVQISPSCCLYREGRDHPPRAPLATLDRSSEREHRGSFYAAHDFFCTSAPRARVRKSTLSVSLLLSKEKNEESFEKCELLLNLIYIYIYLRDYDTLKLSYCDTTGFIVARFTLALSGINLSGHFRRHGSSIGRIPDGALVPSAPLEFHVHVQMRVSKHVDVFDRAVVVESACFESSWTASTASWSGFAIALVS